MSCTPNIVVLLFIVSISVLLCCNAASVGRAGCKFSINSHLKNPQPLILLQNDATTYPEAFPQPINRYGDVVLAAGDAIDVACPGNTVIAGGTDTKQLVVEASCIAGTTFSVQGKQVDFTRLVCKGILQNTARYTGKKCAGNYREIEIGFNINGKFIRHLTICYDQDNQATLYSRVNVTKTINGFQNSYPRPDFEEGNFFDTAQFTVNALYGRGRQRSTINSLLGLSSTDKTYIQDGQYYYLARGHLVAKADVIYGSQQNLTFYYVNVAPQWQTFNGGNWNSLEDDTRRFATSRSLDLEVYTGSYGVSTLPNKSGVQKKLYLFTPSNGQVGIPVPAVFYKVLYDPVSKTGVAFVGVNNPYKKNVQEDVYCKDVCNQINWLTWSKDDNSLGYSYCCEIDELRKTITYIPKLDVRAILK